MNKIQRLLFSYWYVPAILAIVVAAWMGCTPEKGGTLGAPPTATPFTVQGGGASNTAIFVNTTPEVISYWSVNSGPKILGTTDTASFIFAGTFPVTEYVFGHGGMDTVTQQVTINNNNPAACATGVQGFLTGCNQKVWMLDPVADAEMIGPSAGSDAWWGNGASEPTGDRVCDFDDTWTFEFNSSYTMVYNNQGDYYTETYLGNSNNDCDVNADLSAQDQPWASGTFSYQLNPGAGSDPALGQLELVGLGAHIGLPRVENGNDALGDLPASSVTYDIIDTSSDAGGNQYLTIAINGSGGDWWTWVLKCTN